LCSDDQFGLSKASFDLDLPTLTLLGEQGLACP
jgi:hypothetical protein